MMRGTALRNLQHIRKVNKPKTDVNAWSSSASECYFRVLTGERGFASTPCRLAAALHAMPTVTWFNSYVQLMTNLRSKLQQGARKAAAESALAISAEHQAWTPTK